jgi:hypothetical protein
MDDPAPQNQSNAKRRYQWLFGGEGAQKQAPQEASDVLNRIDQEVKAARKLYLAGEGEKGAVKYRGAIDRLESALDATAPGDPVLTEIAKRFSVFEEAAARILGPLHAELGEDSSGRLFHLFEKRRLCRRNLVLKKAVPADGGVDKELMKRGRAPSLDQFRKEIIKPGEMALDFNIMKNRMAVGVITRDKAVYHQAVANAAQINQGVLALQEKLKEYSLAGQTSFLGHAWKEPSRRLHRMLIDAFPKLPEDAATVFIIPDEGLWYLPFSVLLDGEDGPFGANRLVSMIPSGEALAALRKAPGRSSKNDSPRPSLILYESLPWASEEQLKQTANPPKQAGKGRDRSAPSEGERIERLILNSEVYPKPTEIVSKIQRLFKKPHIKAGPQATLEGFMEHGGLAAEVVLVAAPLAMVDAVTDGRRAALFFSPDKTGHRRLDLAALFSTVIHANVAIFPTAWPDASDKSAISGEGPLLMMTALFHSGTPFGMINYAKPDWGDDDSCLLGVLEKIAKGATPGRAWAEFPRTMPANVDSAFAGTPPSWAGWMLFGDPGNQERRQGGNPG